MNITQILQELNLAEGIPLQITTTTSANWAQFGVTTALALLSSVLLLIFFWNSLAGFISPFMIKFYLRKIKRRTGRHVLVIKNSQSGFLNTSMINEKTINKVNEALQEFNGKPFDLLIQTPGGGMFPSLFISRMLKEYPGRIRAMVLGFAMSAGTLLAFSCDELFMNRTSCLGPVDPQLGSFFKFGSARSWDRIVKFKGKKASDDSIGFAFMGSQATRTIRNHLKGLLKNRFKTVGELNYFVKFLTHGDVGHGFALTMSDLRGFGLRVRELKSEEANLLNKILLSELYEGVYYL